MLNEMCTLLVKCSRVDNVFMPLLNRQHALVVYIRRVTLMLMTYESTIRKR